jgi:hypothetical protein
MRQQQRSAQRIGLATKRTGVESCEPDLSLLITQVSPTIGPTPDGQALPDIPSVLDQRELLPEQHIVDAELLVARQTQYQVDLVGPTGKESVGWACAVPALLANLALIFNMWRPQPPSICVDYTIG